MLLLNDEFLLIALLFLVACYATLHPALSVRWSVRLSHFTFLFFLRSLASLLLPKWWSDLKYSSCPPARDWGSRVSGLVLTNPRHLLGSHQNLTKVNIYLTIILKLHFNLDFFLKRSDDRLTVANASNTTSNHVLQVNLLVSCLSN